MNPVKPENTNIFPSKWIVRVLCIDPRIFQPGIKGQAPEGSKNAPSEMFVSSFCFIPLLITAS